MEKKFKGNCSHPGPSGRIPLLILTRAVKGKARKGGMKEGFIVCEPAFVKIHILLHDQKSLLFLAHGGYWVNFISIYQSESLLVLVCYSGIHILACRRGVNSFAFFSRIEASMM